MGDHWVPIKILNPSKIPVILRHNAKVADAFRCAALEDLPISQGVCKPQAGQLKECRLGDIDLEGCEVSDEWTQQLAELLLTYKDVFSKDKLDCREAKDFVHRIHLSNDHPFRLPYHRLPPAHYHKLRDVLSEIELRGIVSKSVSEYASTLVLVWKKSGDLKMCTDFL